MSRTLSWWHQMTGTRDAAGCLQTGRLLQSFLDGDLDEVTARRVARHLEMCRRCGLEATTYTAIKATLARRGTGVDPAAVARLAEFGTSLLVDQRDDPDQPYA